MPRADRRKGGDVGKLDKKTGKPIKVGRAKRVKAAKGASPKGGGAKGSVKPAEATSGTDIPQLDAEAAVPTGSGEALARIGQLEADRTNLMAQVAWARAVAQEQQKTLEIERARAEQLMADLAAQRQRIEQLKSLSLLDRLLGRHKRI